MIKEYMRHVECIQLIRDDWKQCEPFARHAEASAYPGGLIAFSVKDPSYVTMCW
jgi:hypothetical protein